MKTKTDKILDISSGFINMTLGVIGFVVVLFMSSPEVTPLFLVIGSVGFGSMFMYGLNKSINALSYHV